MNNLKIAVVDDHVLFRKGLISILEDLNWKGMTIWEAGTGREAINVAIAHQPQVMFMDISMPVLNGYEASKRILSLYPTTRIIALTTFDEISLIINLFKTGVKGFLSKNIEGSIVEEALRSVMMGDYYYHSRFDELISRWLKAEIQMKVPSIDFTTRELELVVQMAKGLTSQKIAETLKLSPHSVETYRKGLMEKVGVANSNELVAFFYRNGALN